MKFSATISEAIIGALLLGSTVSSLSVGTPNNNNNNNNGIRRSDGIANAARADFANPALAGLKQRTPADDAAAAPVGAAPAATSSAAAGKGKGKNAKASKAAKAKTAKASKAPKAAKASKAAAAPQATQAPAAQAVGDNVDQQGAQDNQQGNVEQEGEN